jgi:hypothetical protein
MHFDGKNYTMPFSCFASLAIISKRRTLHDYLAGSVVLDITNYKKWEIEYDEMMRDAAQP